MKKITIIGWVVCSIVILMFACPAMAGSIFDSKYTKYPRKVYERFCGHHMTAGGHWDCMDAMDRDGVPNLECQNPTYVWVKENQLCQYLNNGWRRAPLNFEEDIVNVPYWPRIYWLYKCCPEGDAPTGP